MKSQLDEIEKKGASRETIDALKSQVDQYQSELGDLLKNKDLLGNLSTVTPQKFIPLAEETSLITPLGEWVLRSACLQCKQWHDQGFGHLIISVNISSVQLRQRSFIETLGSALRESGLPPHALEIEITESIVMENAEAIIHTLHEIKAIGVRLSIDDFGTGYSSLSDLKRFPLSTLKIDRIFMDDVDCDSDSAVIVRTIIWRSISI